MGSADPVDSVREKVIVGLRSYGSLRLLTQIVSWLGTVYVVRHLTSRALGEYGVTFMVFSYLAMTYDGTLLEALVQRAPEDAQQRRAVFSLVVGIGVVLAAATAGCSGLIAHWVGDRAVAPLVLGVSLVLVLTALSVLPHAALARQMAFARLATIAAVQSLCVMSVSVWLAARGAGAWALLAGLIVGAAVRMVLLNASSWGLARPTFRIGRALGYLGFGGILFADNLLWRWYTSLDTFLLGRWTGTAALGYYSLAQQIAELPLEKISRVVNDISLPAYATLRDDRRAAAGLLLETLRSHATVGFPVFWGLAAVGSLFVPVVFGAAWHLTLFPLAALAAVAPLRLMGSIETPAMTGLGRPQTLLKTKLLIVPCMTVALIAGCRLGGIDGAALVWACVFPLCYGLAFRWVLRVAGVSYRQLLAVVRGPALSAAAMTAAVLLWQRLSHPWSLPPIAALVTAIGVGVAAYGIALRLIDPTAYGLSWARLRRIGGLPPRVLAGVGSQ